MMRMLPDLLDRIRASVLPCRLGTGLMLATLTCVSCFGAGTDTRREDAFKAFLPSLPVSVRAAWKSDDQELKTLLEKVYSRPELIIWVDKKHPLPQGFSPANLVKLSSYGKPLVVNSKNLTMEKEAADALFVMAKAAYRSGITLDASSAYRSYSYQIQVFQRNVDEMGEAEAARVSARPGMSQHQLGMAVDFGSITEEYAETKAGKWLALHAWEYGFSLSFPKGLEALTGYVYEPWHYRYIGLAAAKLEYFYFQGIQQNMIVFLHDSKPAVQEWLAAWPKQ